MKLVIISSAPLLFREGKAYAYSPYVKEIVIWEKYTEEIVFCCPIWENQKKLLIDEIPFEFSKHHKLIDFNLNSVRNISKSFFCSIFNLLVIFKAMYSADHIHLRCPGNIGLLGCFVQVFFPKKIKTAKYAGNWDPQSKQPWTYKLQKRILSNTFLTKNMTVLVYGDWKNQTKNIKPFFTATYSENEKNAIEKPFLNSVIEFVFVGSLVSGKSPLYAIKLVEELIKKGHNSVLNLYGDGVERDSLEQYIKENRLENNIFLKGNQNKETLKKAYQKSHFVILPSKSEGWPKAIAEGMFWGCVPISTKVSCVPYMLDYEKRGVLIDMDLQKDVSKIVDCLKENRFLETSKSAAAWSQDYTIEIFESEIKKLLIK